MRESERTDKQPATGRERIKKIKVMKEKKKKRQR